MKSRILMIIALAGLLALATGCSDDDNPTDPGATGLYDLTFTGTIAPHAGQTLMVAVVDEAGDVVVQTDTDVVAPDGVYGFTWTDILAAGHSYRIDFYADHNGSGACDAPPTDHAWRRTTGVVQGDVVVDFQHDTNFTDVCGSF